MKIKLALRYMMALVALALVSCDPLDEVYDELDNAPGVDKGVVSADLAFTLTDEDYELVEDVEGGANVANYHNFDAPSEPRTFIPEILSMKYPHLGKGSSALVTYAYYNGSAPYLSGDAKEATVTSDEYTELGYRYGNFDNLEKDLPIYAEFKFPGASNGTYVDVTHKYYNGSFTETIESRVVKTVPYGWMYANDIPEDAYEDFFQEAHANFSNTTEAEAKIPVYLPKWFPFAEEGEDKLVEYVYYSGGVVYDVAHYTLKDGKWVLYSDGFQTTQESLNFGHDGNAWVPDNTIKYVLSGSDYTKIGAEFAGTPRGDNLSNYGNFSRTGGGTSWSDDQMLEALSFLLNSGGFVTTEGQKYILTVVVYNGATVTEDWSLIRTDGEWVLNN